MLSSGTGSADARPVVVLLEPEGAVEIAEIELDPPKAAEVLVRVAAAGSAAPTSGWPTVNWAWALAHVQALASRRQLSSAAAS